ncbi:MAG: sulfate adenylyltransferase [Lachnospiraceae bacterium]|uniref:sulfate adenylyltransferase n=1 Tax=Candidatus Weimeria bifida TaxID=2599074 RepID=A0A6N7J1H8_9FIRM|nr:sulfate adenylyltransferase [Candidatus Weimeria bifida]RRF96520.1 MAG: sulfate adenylyltransferase [Lachnospiraceae bacterium]
MSGLLKFITCGSVDDGKSTLIGHLLYDAKLLYADQEDALKLDSKVGSRGGDIDYSLLLDGLQAEREQGITIDVAYRYFTTDRRSFICADTPGHEEYTRNMACGASFADLAIILIDATKGVLVQTRRHARICALMGIRYFVFAVNKMDLADYSEDTFDKIKKQIEELKKELSLYSAVIIPVSATEGDNITKRSSNMDWYKGPVLQDYLETVDIDEATENEKGFYMPVQRVCRPSHEFRGFQGQIEHGTVKIGDEVRSLPSGEKAHVKGIIVADHSEESAVEGQPVTIQLDREVDVSRGCVIESGTDLKAADSFETEVLWMDDDSLTLGKNFLVKLGTKLIPGLITEIKYKIDINTGEHQSTDTLKKNEIAVVTIAVTEPVIASEFSKYRTMGELILIDRITNMTSACGVITKLEDGTKKRHYAADRAARSALNWQSPLVVEFRPFEDGTSVDEIEEAEFKLTSSGRHTYFYHPQSGEDYANVVKNLFEAGLIVLIVLDEDQKENDSLASNEHCKTWSVLRDSDKDVTSDQISAKIFQSTYSTVTLDKNNWII